MARDWTKPQLKAIETKNKTLLVSAAAGSGKTATLTERIIRRITDKNDPADISRMLIATFTRQAAAELRSRIFEAIGEALALDPSNTHLASQLMKLGSAKICTIDSFYLDMVKSNFSALSIPSSFRNVDDAEYLILAREAMDKSIEEMYESDPDFPTFCECFTTVREANKITDTIINLHKKLSSIPEGIKYVAICSKSLKESSETDFFSTSYGKEMRKDTAEFFEYYRDIFRTMLDYIQSDEEISKAYSQSFTIDYEYCDKLYKTLSDESCTYLNAQSSIFSFSPKRLGNLNSQFKTDEVEACKKSREAFSKSVGTLRKKTFLHTPEKLSRYMLDTAKYLDVLYRLLEIFEAKITEVKSRLSIMTFSDIRRLALSLVTDENGEPTQLAKEYAKQFSEIYIDEYQDVDRVQDLIFRSISTPTNRFMVGDIKQSIYGFRGAEPLLFSECRKAFPPVENSANSENATIFMSNNFRCDENIIKFTNSVCAPLFSLCPDSIAYTPEDDLKFSKTTPAGYLSQKVKIALIAPPPEESDEDEEKDADARRIWEAKYIASEIERLTKEKSPENSKQIKLGDIAVLFRTSKILPALTAALDERNILYSLSDSESYFENPEVLLLLAVLNTIDNPERDIHLAGTLRSPLFNFSMDDIIAIRKASPPLYSLYGALTKYAKLDSPLSAKCAEFIAELERWQADAVALPIDRFLRILFESDRFIASGIVSQTDVRGQGGNLLVLYEYARNFEGGSFKGLYQFVEYINSIISRGQKLSSDTKSKVEDRVSLMTIHKSKGLEFPVCFLCGTTSSFTKKEQSQSLICEYPTGIALKISDGKGFGRIDTPMRNALKSRIRTQSMEESMRLLYVALTRAKERLYLTATTMYSPEKLFEQSSKNAAHLNRYTIINKCYSYMDWILPSLKEAGDTYEFFTVPFTSLIKNSSSNSMNAKSPQSHEDASDPELVERLSREFSFEYPYRALSHVPAKLSVSKLSPDILDENEDSLNLFSADGKAAPVPEFFSGQNTSAKSAQRGTATHLFFQFCDFKRLANSSAEEEISRLKELKFLPSDAPDMIYVDEIEAFTESELFKKILKAKQIVREQRFNVELPAIDFTLSAALSSTMSNETLAVQGVIDLLIIDENGDISLYDYKTDRLSRAEREDFALAKKKLSDSHALQLSYYKKAVELLFGKPCKDVCVYSTHSALLYPIDPII